MTAHARNTDPITSHEAADGVDLMRSQTLVLCAVNDCPKTIFARGWCQAHYTRWKRHGDPLAGRAPRSGTPEESFAARTRWEGDCLIWTGAQTPNGYGYISVDGKQVPVHRYAFEQAHGPIPDGHEVDHKCHRPPCCNADHLRTATRTENLRNKAGAKPGSSTGVRNVTPNGKGYAVNIKVNRVNRYLGTYRTLEEAEAVAVKNRIGLFGEFAGGSR